MTTLFEMAAALTRADAAMLQAGVDLRTRLTVLDTISQATIAKELELPDWRREELARKHGMDPRDAWTPTRDEYPDPREGAYGPIADDE